MLRAGEDGVEQILLKAQTTIDPAAKKNFPHPSIHVRTTKKYEDQVARARSGARFTENAVVRTKIPSHSRLQLGLLQRHDCI